MSVFEKFYDGVVDLFIDKNKIEEYGTKGAEPVPIDECPECRNNCSPTCECRWCHFSSCAKCDEENCNIRTCPDPCHGDKGGRYLNNEPVLPLPKSFEANDPSDYTLPVFQSGEGARETSFKMKKKVDVKALVKGIAGETKTEIDFQKMKGEEKEKKKLERKSENMGVSLGLQMAAEELNEQDKPKIANKRTSKYCGMLSGTIQDNNGNIVSDGKRSFNNKSVISFKSKSKSKEKNKDKVLLNQIEAQAVEQKIDVDTRKKISLAGKLKAEFGNFKIKDMNTPDKLDNHVTEKFRREKAEISKIMHGLDDEIRAENYTENEKLMANIFADFEKQESWQSYTTLLFADIKDKPATK